MHNGIPTKQAEGQNIYRLVPFGEVVASKVVFASSVLSSLAPLVVKLISVSNIGVASAYLSRLLFKHIIVVLHLFFPSPGSSATASDYPLFHASIHSHFRR